jgi:hypothetical protein
MESNPFRVSAELPFDFIEVESDAAVSHDAGFLSPRKTMIVVGCRPGRNR